MKQALGPEDENGPSNPGRSDPAGWFGQWQVWAAGKGDGLFAHQPESCRGRRLRTPEVLRWTWRASLFCMGAASELRSELLS